MGIQNSRRNRTIDLKTYGDYNVTKNIKFKELKGGFSSYSISQLKAFRFNLRTLQYVQLCRSFFGMAIAISGSWRTKEQNSQVGGIANSAHLYNNKYGGAIDFYSVLKPNLYKWAFVYLLRRIKEVVGIKYMYLEVGRDGFSHCDDRDNGLGVQQSNGKLINGYTLKQIGQELTHAGGASLKLKVDNLTKKEMRTMLDNVRKENVNYYKLYKKGVKWLK